MLVVFFAFSNGKFLQAILVLGLMCKLLLVVKKRLPSYRRESWNYRRVCIKIAFEQAVCGYVWEAIVVGMADGTVCVQGAG